MARDTVKVRSILADGPAAEFEANLERALTLLHLPAYGLFFSDCAGDPRLSLRHALLLARSHPCSVGGNPTVQRWFRDGGLRGLPGFPPYPALQQLLVEIRLGWGDRCKEWAERKLVTEHRITPTRALVLGLSSYLSDPEHVGDAEAWLGAYLVQHPADLTECQRNLDRFTHTLTVEDVPLSQLLLSLPINSPHYALAPWVQVHYRTRNIVALAQWCGVDSTLPDEPKVLQLLTNKDAHRWTSKTP